MPRASTQPTSTTQQQPFFSGRQQAIKLPRKSNIHCQAFCYIFGHLVYQPSVEKQAQRSHPAHGVIFIEPFPIYFYGRMGDRPPGLNYLPNYNHVSNRRIEEEEDIFPEKRADLQ